MTNRRTSIALLVPVLTLLLASCGARVVGDDASSTDGGLPQHDPGAGPFAGQWSGTTNSSVMLVLHGSDAGSMSSTSTSQVNVSITSTTPDSMSITISSADGSGSCTFVAERMGSTATLPAGQTCAQPDAGTTGMYTLQSGAASVSGNVVQVAVVMSGTFTSGGTTIDATVTLSITATLH